MSADRESLRRRILAEGAAAVGFASARPTQKEERERLREWIAAGRNAGMSWMERHLLLRRDPGNVLPGARTVICAAFPYAPATPRYPELPVIARYACSPDYHETLRATLGAVMTDVTKGSREGEWRVCVDSAPLPERYWALRAGLGLKGDNGMLIVPGTGCEVFLAEILTTLEFEPDEPSARECLHCGACRRACPTGALLDDGTIDCRRCISYLTIEHHGPWNDPEARSAMNTPAGKRSLFGCDACVTACPLNNPAVRGPETLKMLLCFDGSDMPESKGAFRRAFAGTSLLRTGRDGLLRNLENLEI